MRIIDTFRMAFTALIRQKVRTFLTAFAIFIGVFIIIFLVSLSFGAQKLLLSQITNQFDLKSIFVLRKGCLYFNFLSTTAKEDKKDETKSLDDSTVEEIKKIDNVTLVQPIVRIAGRKFEFTDKTFDDRVIASAVGGGWDLAEGDSVYNKIYAGKVTNLQDNEVIITKNISDAYKKDASEFIGKEVVLTDVPNLLGSQSKPKPARTYTIVGVVGTIRDFLFLTNLHQGLDINAEKNGYASTDEFLKSSGYQTIYVKSSEETKVNGISNGIKALGYDVTTLEDVLKIFNSFFNIIPIIFTIIGIIAIFVASIGIINTMVMSVYERTREIGVMKAVGAKNTDILGLFITEAGLIGFIGGVLAVGVSLLIMSGAQSIIINNILPSLEVEGITQIFETPLYLLYTSVIFSTLVGVLSGLYPAIRASRLNPVDALRYE